MNTPGIILEEARAFAFGRGVCDGALTGCLCVDSVAERAQIIAFALLELIDHAGPDDAAAGFAYELASRLCVAPGLAS